MFNGSPQANYNSSRNPYNNATTNPEQGTLGEKGKLNAGPGQIAAGKPRLMIMNGSLTPVQNQNPYQGQQGWNTNSNPFRPEYSASRNYNGPPSYGNNRPFRLGPSNYGNNRPFRPPVNSAAFFGNGDENNFTMNYYPDSSGPWGSYDPVGYGFWGSNQTPEQPHNGFSRYKWQDNSEPGREQSETESPGSNETIPHTEEFIGHVGAITTKTKSKTKLSKLKRTARSRNCQVCGETFQSGNYLFKQHLPGCQAQKDILRVQKNILHDKVERDIVESSAPKEIEDGKYSF